MLIPFWILPLCYAAAIAETNKSTAKQQIKMQILLWILYRRAKAAAENTKSTAKPTDTHGDPTSETTPLATS